MGKQKWKNLKILHKLQGKWIKINRGYLMTHILISRKTVEKVLL